MNYKQLKVVDAALRHSVAILRMEDFHIIMELKYILPALQFHLNFPLSPILITLETMSATH